MPNYEMFFQHFPSFPKRNSEAGASTFTLSRLGRVAHVAAKLTETSAKRAWLSQFSTGASGGTSRSPYFSRRWVRFSAIGHDCLRVARRRNLEGRGSLKGVVRAGPQHRLTSGLDSRPSRGERGRPGSYPMVRPLVTSPRAVRNLVRTCVRGRAPFKARRLPHAVERRNLFSGSPHRQGQGWGSDAPRTSSRSARAATVEPTRLVTEHSTPLNDYGPTIASGRTQPR